LMDLLHRSAGGVMLCGASRSIGYLDGLGDTSSLLRGGDCSDVKRGQNFEAETKTKASRPRPKFLSRGL